MRISTQAMILAACNAVIFIAVVIAMFLTKEEADKGSKVVAIMKNIVSLLAFFIMMALQVYSLNCMVYGECYLWSWIIAIFSVIGLVIFILGFIYIIYMTKSVGNAMNSLADMGTTTAIQGQMSTLPATAAEPPAEEEAPPAEEEAPPAEEEPPVEE